MGSMAALVFPAQMQKDGAVTTARSASEYWNLYYAGWRPTADPVPVDDGGTFTDAAVAALIDNMDSQTFAALARRFIGVDKLVISANPPSASPPPDGTVWVKNHT
jgi:hypothetical protein